MDGGGAFGRGEAEDGGGGDEDIAAGLADGVAVGLAEASVHLEALVGLELVGEDFLDLDDVTLLHGFKVWSRGADATLAELCRGLLYRRLFKTIELSADADAVAVTRAVDDATDAVTRAGGDPAYGLFYDEVRSTPYEMADAGREISVSDASGRLRPLSAVSGFAVALGRPLVLRRLHVAEAYRDAALAAVCGVMAG